MKQKFISRATITKVTKNRTYLTFHDISGFEVYKDGAQMPRLSADKVGRKGVAISDDGGAIWRFYQNNKVPKAILLDEIKRLNGALANEKDSFALFKEKLHEMLDEV